MRGPEHPPQESHPEPLSVGGVRAGHVHRPSERHWSRTAVGRESSSRGSSDERSHGLGGEREGDRERSGYHCGLRNSKSRLLEREGIGMTTARATRGYTRTKRGDAHGHAHAHASRSLGRVVAGAVAPAAGWLDRRRRRAGVDADPVSGEGAPAHGCGRRQARRETQRARNPRRGEGKARTRR